MIMTRLGIDTELFYEAEDFSVITNFNTPETLNALGIASSDIAEMGLGEISRIYIDNEGVREEFKSEWQANDYLEQVKKSVSELDTAKALIDEYCRDEFEREEGADYTDLSNVELAYTTTEDDKHEIQARVNLVDYRLETLADGNVIRSEQFSSLEDMIERSLL